MRTGGIDTHTRPTEAAMFRTLGRVGFGAPKLGSGYAVVAADSCGWEVIRPR